MTSSTTSGLKMSSSSTFGFSEIASSLSTFVNRSTDVLSDTISNKLPQLATNAYGVVVTHSDNNNNNNNNNSNNNTNPINAAINNNTNNNFLKSVQSSQSLAGFLGKASPTSMVRQSSEVLSPDSVRSRSRSVNQQHFAIATVIPECRLDPFEDAADSDDSVEQHPDLRSVTSSPGKESNDSPSNNCMLLDPQLVWRKYSAGSHSVGTKLNANVNGHPSPNTQTRKHSFAGFGSSEKTSSWLQLPDLTGHHKRASSLTPEEQYLPDSLRRRMSTNSQLLQLAQDLDKHQTFINNHEQILRDLTPGSRRPSLGINSLGSINPDLYKDPIEGEIAEYPPGHIGRLWMTLVYEQEKLSVTISKVRNLPPRPGSNDPTKSCDSYVRLITESLDPSACYTQETKVKRKTVNPTFGETFIFQIDHDIFDEATLKLVVLDVTPIKRHVTLGSVTFPLSDYTICKQHKLSVWRDLKKEEPKQDSNLMLGNITLSLCYHSDSSKLSVHLIEASDLVPSDTSKEHIDTYCKVTFSCGGKQLKQKKSKVIKKSLHPMYNEMFDCKVPACKLDTASIYVQIMQYKPDKQIGFLELPGLSASSGKPFEQWQSMCRQHNTMITDTHDLCL